MSMSICHGVPKLSNPKPNKRAQAPAKTGTSSKRPWNMTQLFLTGGVIIIRSKNGPKTAPNHTRHGPLQPATLASCTIFQLLYGSPSLRCAARTL